MEKHKVQTSAQVLTLRLVLNGPNEFYITAWLNNMQYSKVIDISIQLKRLTITLQIKPNMVMTWWCDSEYSSYHLKENSGFSE